MNKPIPPHMSICAGTDDWHKRRDKYLRELHKYVGDLEQKHEALYKEVSQINLELYEETKENEALKRENEELLKLIDSAFGDGFKIAKQTTPMEVKTIAEAKSWSQTLGYVRDTYKQLTEGGEG